MTDLKQFYGITITNIFDPNLEGKLKHLKETRTKNTDGVFVSSGPIIARVVNDKLDDYAPLIPRYEMISKYCKPMLQICDSYLDGKLTDDEYNAREMFFLEHLSEFCPFVEIGNEVGSGNDWSGKNMLERVRNSSVLWVGHERILTTFWIDDFEEMLNFLQWHEIDCEHNLLSFYPQSIIDFQPLSDLQKEAACHGFINLGLSEFGFENWQGHISDKMKKVLIARAYKIGSPVMLWDWQESALY